MSSVSSSTRRDALTTLGCLALGLPVLSACGKKEATPPPMPSTDPGAGAIDPADPSSAVAAPQPPKKVEEKAKDKDKDKPVAGRAKFVLMVDSMDSPMRNFQQVLTKRLLRTRAGVDLVMVRALGDAQRQVAQLRSQFAEGARYFLVFPVEAETLKAPLMELKAAGATIIVFSKDVPASACTTAIFTDDAKLGALAGDFVIAALQQKCQAEGRPETVGRVVQITGPEGDPATETISIAFQASLKKAPGVQLVHDAPGNWAADDGTARFNDALRLQKQFDVVFAHSDFMAKGASKAARAATPPVRDSLLILGLDGNPGQDGGLSMVINSEIDATIYRPLLIDHAWKVCLRLLEAPTFQPKPRYDLAPQLVTLEVAETLQRKGPPSVPL
ncbi:MAG: substrate-binding domain-containing protein [Verrucomicrobium sp.]|nr:substrate-binding domain-containing protein [Verrucomicrobium sp.]